MSLIIFKREFFTKMKVNKLILSTVVAGMLAGGSVAYRNSRVVKPQAGPPAPALPTQAQNKNQPQQNLMTTPETDHPTSDQKAQSSQPAKGKTKMKAKAGCPGKPGEKHGCAAKS